jgi:hypothetical protein
LQGRGFQRPGRRRSVRSAFKRRTAARGIAAVRSFITQGSKACRDCLLWPWLRSRQHAKRLHGCRLLPQLASRRDGTGQAKRRDRLAGRCSRHAASLVRTLEAEGVHFRSFVFLVLSGITKN